MSSIPFRHLITLGAIAPSRAFALATGCLALLFVVDILAGSTVTLHVFYVFPLAMIALHCPQRPLLLLGFTATLALQFSALFQYDIALLSKVVNMSEALFSSTLVLLLATTLRDSLLELSRLATRDPLTGLHNRRNFQALAEREMERHKRYGTIFSLAMIDLDHFKNLNDSRGHGVGDDALRLVARILGGGVRQTDAVGRFGGDEFAILMPETNREACALLCAKLVSDIEREMGAAAFSLTASIGCAAVGPAIPSLVIAYEQADKALYEAKSQGRNRSVCLPPS